MSIGPSVNEELGNAGQTVEGLAEDLASVIDSVATPTIKTPADSQLDVTVVPAATTKLNEVTNFENTTNTDLCGNAELEAGDPEPQRFVMEGILVKSQKEKLQVLRRTGGQVRIISDVHTGTIQFDMLDITQKSGEKTGEFRINGKELSGAVFQFQLQAKAEDNQS